MAFLGMFSVGAFVGAILTLGLGMVSDWNNFQKTVTFVLSAAFTGVVFDFIGFLGGAQLGPAIFMYPIGLLVALLWFYASIALANIRESNRSLQLLGWGHMLGVVVSNLVAAALVLPPAFRDVWPNVLK